MTSKKQEPKLLSSSFEKNMETLQQIVDELESQSLSLGDSLSKFEQGIKLLKETSHSLESAEQRVAMLTIQGDKAEGEETGAPS